jgi:mono/diheme cytochrome c family protein
MARTRRATNTHTWVGATALSLLVVLAAACSSDDDAGSPAAADNAPIAVADSSAPATDTPTTPSTDGAHGDGSHSTESLSTDAPTTDAPAVESTVPQLGTVSFRTQVMPVLEQNCASCHNSGGIGSHEWELDDAADAAEAALDIDLFTSTRYMPPWPASRVGAPLAHDRSLTDEEIQAITTWVTEGGQLDVDLDAPIAAPADAREAFDADIELALAEPYEGSTDKPNDYRCFLIDPQLADTTWVTGYEFQADEPEVVHHALAFRIADPGQLAGLQAQDAADPKSGWGCDGGGTSVGQFMAWAPGQDPTRLPDGVGMKMNAGDYLMLQIHYHYGHHSVPDRSRFRLAVAEPGTELTDLIYRTYLAPAEIPCRPGIEEGPLCDRDAVVAELIEDYGPFGGFIPDVLARACGKTREELAVLVDGVARASCDHFIGDNTTALSVFGHMHEIGDTFRMTLNKGTDREQVLLDIPNWDFDWQLNFDFAEPVDLSVGDVITVECSWDRNRLDPPQPRYITWSEGTEDEMCYSALTLIPRND